ncbi:MAG: HAMP domain-containing protein [Actinobacteria bacterium]|nr:HAMP domain-containing protein [Actinomycetota bacterium]
MEPAVPFALLGTVQLLAVASWVALGAAGVALARGRLKVLLLVAGALVLAGAEIATSLRFGRTSSDSIAFARAAGGLLLAGGLAAAAAAAFASPLADDGPGWAATVVSVRGLGALAVLGGLVLLSRTSLLAKVVAGILAGVLAASVAALGVVGTVVVSSYQRQSNLLVRQTSVEREANLNRLAGAARSFVVFAEAGCVPKPATCPQLLRQFTDNARTGDFVVRIPRAGTPASAGGRKPLSPSERLGLAQDPAVRAVLTTTTRFNEPPTAVVRLVGAQPVLAVVAIKPNTSPNPSSVTVYGIRLDDDYAANDVDLSSDVGVSILVDGEIVASNLPQRQRALVGRVADEAGVDTGVDDNGVTVPATATRPTVRFTAVRDGNDVPLGVLAVSRNASAALAAQRDALQALLISALLATALVGGLALLLGRRTVDPVRRLTAAAARVSAGDLQASADVRSADEVGVLSRTFDTMTGSLLQLTDELRGSAARLQTVLTSMSDGLVATDGAGRVTSINPAALAMIGLSEADAIGRPLGAVVDVRDAADAPLDLSGRLPDEAAVVQPAGDGEGVPVRVALAPLEGGDGVVLVLRDTSREREVERMKTEFLSNVSHELRTPLTPIRGYAEILVAKPGLAAEKVTTFATTIRDESIKMNRVVDLLVDVAAIEAGRVTVTPRPVTVKELVDTRLEAWRSRAPQRAKDLKKRVATGLPPVMVDPQWVGKALDELVDNAVKYTSPGTSITFVATLAGDSVRVAVKDAGPGIAEADQRLLFTSFEQVDGSATRRVGGLGLGLSFVRRLAEDAGFPLSVTSTVGKGSEFALDLPVSDEAVPDSGPRRASPARRRRAPVRGPSR